jgi:hypothetical protein
VGRAPPQVKRTPSGDTFSRSVHRIRRSKGILEAMETAGQRVRAALDRTLPQGMAWDESELLTLDHIERAADRLAKFQARFDAAEAKPDASPSRLATLSGECRLLEGAIQKWAATLDPHNEVAKSMRHVHAANARWRRNSGT